MSIAGAGVGASSVVAPIAIENPKALKKELRDWFNTAVKTAGVAFFTLRTECKRDVEPTSRSFVIEREGDIVERVETVTHQIKTSDAEFDLKGEAEMKGMAVSEFIFDFKPLQKQFSGCRAFCKGAKTSYRWETQAFMLNSCRVPIASQTWIINNEPETHT